MAKMRFALAETKQPFSLYFKHKLFDKNMAQATVVQGAVPVIRGPRSCPAAQL